MPEKEAYAQLEHKLMALRENSRTGDERKTLDEVFDHETVMGIYKLMTSKIIESVLFPISTGKEGNVFACENQQGKLLALKIYRTSNSTFNRVSKYIEGDKRFLGISGSKRKVMAAWASKEFRNLQRMHEARVNVPEPIKFHRNMVVMEYIGTKTAPAPTIRQVELDDPSSVYKNILDNVRLMYQKAGLVHADLSEYNILYYKRKPVIIDVGQAVLTDHLNSKDFLERDVKNINRYFRSLDVDIEDTDCIINKIMGIKE